MHAPVGVKPRAIQDTIADQRALPVFRNDAQGCLAARAGHSQSVQSTQPQDLIQCVNHFHMLALPAEYTCRIPTGVTNPIKNLLIPSTVADLHGKHHSSRRESFWKRSLLAVARQIVVEAKLVCYQCIFKRMYPNCKRIYHSKTPLN
ncbi:hypothetical protein Q31a_16640 [Aureliella helgolandensis]|uniref:Uncharacterized protein n=1 Tax=Aureliella helgolandensis TaxID=2527968 RepID=A0A518G437_9BACT|nr:hypothetical protein Q31a_16640 [Aureliella helgolandensis]